MNVFTFNPSAYRDHFEAHGWAHVRHGVNPGLLAALQEQVSAARAEEQLRGPGLKGEKAQHLFDTADLPRFCGELFDAVCTICGTDPERMTLSERHVKVYDADADPDPEPHKDRFASFISVGLSIAVPQGSQLLLYPSIAREENRFLTAEHRASLAGDERPEVALAGAEPIVIEDRPGDVVLFHGSSTWHRRRHAANAALLYLKCNDFDCDPLGEDPTTPSRRALSIDLVRSVGDEELDALVPVQARQLESVLQEYGRDGSTSAWAKVFGITRTAIAARELELIRTVDGIRPVASLGDGDRVRQAVRRLVALGALDLLTMPYGDSSRATASAIALVDAGDTPLPGATRS